MLLQIGQFIIDTATAFFVVLLLARFHFQWLRVPFRNQVGEFIVVCTDWIVRPARRIIPPLAKLDLATGLAAWALETVGLLAALALAGWDPGSRVGAAGASVVMIALVELLRYSVYMLVFAVIVQAVLSWVSPYHPFAGIFDAMTRPFLRPFRRWIPTVANIDLSPLLLLVVLQIVLIPLAHLRAAVATLG